VKGNYGASNTGCQANGLERIEVEILDKTREVMGVTAPPCICPTSLTVFTGDVVAAEDIHISILTI
jgi:hypothetical protein